MANLTVAQAKQQLEISRPSLDKMNINKVSLEREIEYAIQAFQANPYLLGTVGIEDVLKNIVLSGLSLSPVLKYAYLVPRKIKNQMVCCVDPSYQGLVKIVTDTGSVKNISANVVYEKDAFDIELGSGGFVKHKPYLGVGTRGRKIGAYSIAALNDGTYSIDFMRWDEIMAIKARSESVKNGSFSPWKSDEDEMAKKTVVKRHWKYLPKSERALMAASAIHLDNQTNGIDFEEEQNNNSTPPTANAAQYALATEEDRDNFIKLIDHPGLGDKVCGGKKNKAPFKAEKLKLYDDGLWAKDEYEAIAGYLKKDIEAIQPASQADPMDDEANAPAPTTEAAAPVSTETAPEAAAQPPVKKDFE